jgi:Arc/MetJ family transcription regulator
MPTNLAIDDRLIVEAQKVGGHRSKKETVNQALTEYIQHHKQQKIVGLFNRLDWDPNYDPKAGRKRQ